MANDPFAQMEAAQAQKTAASANQLISPRTSRTRINTFSTIASPPTLTNGSAYAGSTVNVAGAFNAPTIPWTDARLVYPGSVPLIYSSLNYLSIPQTVQTGASSRSPNVWIARFVTDASKFDFLTKNTGSYSLIVDGQILSTASNTSLTAGPAGSFYVTVDFGSDAIRHIELVLGGQGYFGGINVPIGYTAWAWPIIGPRLMILGDSYTQLTGSDFAMGGFAPQMGRILGVEDTWISGVGGTGYLATNGIATLRSRIATDITPYKPTHLAVFGGINDYTQTAVALQAEVTLFYQALYAALPNIVCVAYGPFTSPSKTVSSALAAAIKAGVQAVPQYGSAPGSQLTYVDTFAAPVYQSGTGYNGTGSNNGNSYRYIGADAVHPIQIGHNYLAQRGARDFSAAVGWPL